MHLYVSQDKKAYIRGEHHMTVFNWMQCPTALDRAWAYTATSAPLRSMPLSSTQTAQEWRKALSAGDSPSSRKSYKGWAFLVSKFPQRFPQDFPQSLEYLKQFLKLDEAMIRCHDKPDPLNPTQTTFKIQVLIYSKSPVPFVPSVSPNSVTFYKDESWAFRLQTWILTAAINVTHSATRQCICSKFFICFMKPHV